MNQFVASHKNTPRPKSVLLFIAVLLLVMFEPSTFFSIYRLNSIFIKLGIIAVVFIWIRASFYNSDIMRIDRNVFVVFFMLSCSIMLSKVLHLDSSGYYYELILQILCALVVVYAIPVEDFCKYFTKVMLFIAIYSVVTTYSILFIPQIRAIFPTFRHVSDVYYNGWILFSDAIFSVTYLSASESIFRNYGPFREPGVFVIYLCLGMILDLFYCNKESRSTKRFVIWNIAILTTFSTAGIIIVSIIDWCYVTAKGSSYKNKVKRFIFIIVAIVTILNIGPIKDIVFNATDKLNGGGSFDSRYGSFVGACKAWLLHPIFGCGYTSIISGADSVYIRQFTNAYTNTAILVFSIFGSVFGACYNLGWGKMFRRFQIPWIIVAAFLVALCTEEMIRCSILYCIVLYGYSSLNSIEV